MGTSEQHVHIEQKEYHGWKNAYWISNNLVDLVVVPEIGRVVRYGYLNRENLLWENAAIAPAPGVKSNGWVNYGGDKVWAAPQTKDTWPPDPKIDPGPYTAEVLANGVQLTGPSDSKFKVKITRKIELDNFGSKVNFTNLLQNLGEPRKLCPWQVTQLDDPSLVIMPHRMTGSQPYGFYNYGNSHFKADHQEIRGDELRLKRDPQESRKFGSYGLKGEITAVKRTTVFHTVQTMTRNSTYPDLDSPQQVYLSADPLAYVELEQVAPLIRMETFQVAVQKVQWFLTEKL